jgi:hypothetical protein
MGSMISSRKKPKQENIATAMLPKFAMKEIFAFSMLLPEVIRHTRFFVTKGVTGTSTAWIPLERVSQSMQFAKHGVPARKTFLSRYSRIWPSYRKHSTPDCAGRWFSAIPTCTLAVASWLTSADSQPCKCMCT